MIFERNYMIEIKDGYIKEKAKVRMILNQIEHK